MTETVSKNNKGKRKLIDWEPIGKEYRLGQKSLRNIADEYGISHTAIRKHAKQEGWTRDLTKEIKRRTEAALLGSKDEVSKEKPTPTREDIEVAVETNVKIIRGHRKSLQRGLEIVNLLYQQLNDVAHHRETIEQLITKNTKGEKGKPTKTRQRTAMMKAVSIPSHAGVMRDLSTALKNLLPLERQAFNIDAKSDDENPVSKLLDEVAKRAAPLVKD